MLAVGRVVCHTSSDARRVIGRQLRARGSRYEWRYNASSSRRCFVVASVVPGSGTTSHLASHERNLCLNWQKSFVVPPIYPAAPSTVASILACCTLSSSHQIRQALSVKNYTSDLCREDGSNMLDMRQILLKQLQYITGADLRVPVQIKSSSDQVRAPPAATVSSGGLAIGAAVLHLLIRLQSTKN